MGTHCENLYSKLLTVTVAQPKCSQLGWPHAHTHARTGLNLSCLCFPGRQEVPGSVHAWTWCPAGLTLGSAVKYPIYYSDELPWNFAPTQVRREFSVIANARSTNFDSMKHLGSFHTFSMKFGADMNGFHLPFSQDSLPSRWEERCRLRISKFSSDAHIRSQINEWIRWENL